MEVPVLGPSVPRRGNRITAAVGRFALGIFGWRLEGGFPDLPKFVVIGAPHTSNWDFYFAMAGMFALGLRASWLGKASLFRGPAAWYMRWLGGIPVRRDRHEGVVEDTVEAFRAREQLVVGLSPEGTRKKVKRWRTGFYHIAAGAKVPVVLVALDYANRVIRLGPAVTPTGNLRADMALIRGHYAKVQGKHPDRF